MSILLSVYYPEGIVFVADKNITLWNQHGNKYVEPSAKKVIAWPNKKALVGFVGLFQLNGLFMDCWMNLFISQNSRFNNMAELANKLREAIQKDFNNDYSHNRPIPNEPIIIHMGGYEMIQNCIVPVMYHICNHGGVADNGYSQTKREFTISEDIKPTIDALFPPEEQIYPKDLQGVLRAITQANHSLWFNNGASLIAFNTFKDNLWTTIRGLKEQGQIPDLPGINSRIALCKMAVSLFGSFFNEYYGPENQAVGGGVDCEFIEWPAISSLTGQEQN